MTPARNRLLAAFALLMSATAAPKGVKLDGVDVSAAFTGHKELNAHITPFLKDTEAVVPKANSNHKKPAPAVAGWTASKDATLSEKEGTLLITATGGGPFTVELTLTSCWTRTAMN